MQATPPLMDLAWMNLAHWQSYSDQRSILRFVRIALLFVAGLDDEEMEKPITIGANRTFRSKNPNAKMEYVEHTGKGVEAGQEDLNKIEGRMQTLGLRPYTSRPGTVTATES